MVEISGPVTITEPGTYVLINDIVASGHGIVVTCNVPGSTALCIFNDFEATRPIPTLSEWGMIAVAAGLMIVGVFFALRRRRAAAA